MHTTGNSSKLAETFIDEEYRLIKGAASYTVWDPLVTLSNNLTGSNVTSTGVSSGPFSDACTVGSNLVQGSKYFADTGSANNFPGGAASFPALYPTVIAGNLSSDPYLPWTSAPGTSGATNPDYSAGNNYDRDAVYHRLFEASAGNQNRPIASFEIGFKGKFPTTGNVYDELVNNNLIVYIRKKNNTQSPAVNIGAGAVPHSLHNGNMSGANGAFNAAYANPPTSVDANDGTAQCRVTATAPVITNGYYVIAGSFGQPVTQCMDGFYIEVHYRDENIRIDDLKCKIFFAAGTPTDEGSSS